MPDMKLFAGNAVPELAQKVADRLYTKLGNAKVGRFSDGEISVEIHENVRGSDVFIIQSTCAPTNDNLMELIVMIDALRRASAGRITAVIPYFGYARQDRRVRSARVPITAKVVADFLSNVGVDRVLTIDLHAEQIQGFFDVPVDNAFGTPILLADMVRRDFADPVVVSPDIGGGFGNKVGAYPGYVCSVVASIVTGLPVKWVEDRMENLMTTAFARDYWMKGKISATKEGKITGLWCHTTADHGGFDACADPTKFPAGFMNICTGSYDIPTAYLAVDGVYTNKAPGGVAYRCSFRVTEAAYFIERMIEVLAIELNMDAAELRRINFIKQDQFPYTSALGWEYDSGDYHTAWDKALEAVGYDDLRKEQAQRVEDFKAGKTRKLLGIGLTHFTEIVGAGPVKNCDILGLGMFDSCEIRIHPTGSAIARLGTISQGQGHATTFAQILASEIGLPADSITIEEGDTDTAPYGLGTYGSRSTPVAGAATAMAGRKIRAKAQMIAAYMLEVHDDDVEFDVDRFVVKGAPERFKTMKEIAFAAYNQAIPGIEPGLEAVSYYDPPNMTYPFGAYVCVMEIDVDTGEHEIRQFYALDDCGTRINPMIIEGQVHGGLTEALAIAMGQEIAYDNMGNVKTGTLMDFFLPTAWETPNYTTDHTTTPSPHHPIGAKGVGESPNVGGVPAFSNAVHDAFRAFGLRQVHMPHDHWRIWKTANDLGLHG